MTRKLDLLVVGAGPAGIAAATAAAVHGRQVTVLDDNPAAGGQVWRGGVASPSEKADAGKKKWMTAFRDSGAELLAGRAVFDMPRPGVLRTVKDVQGNAVQESFAWQSLILATGARERFLPFPGWTLPGVFGAGGLQALVKGGYSVAGKRVVVAGTGPLLLAVAAHLHEYGAKIICVAEQTSLLSLIPFTASLCSQPAKLLQGAGYRVTLAGVPYRTGCWPTGVERFGKGLIVRLTSGAQQWNEECDLLACGFHLVPNTEVAALLGCRLDGDAVAVDQYQQTSLPGIFCAGEPTGIAGLDAAMVQGTIAGLSAAGETAKAVTLFAKRDKEWAFGRRLSVAFALRRELRSLAAPDTIVCRCEDVTFARLQGHTSWTEAKLQSRCGMGPCQGRICGPAVQTIFGWQPASVRPPLFPVPVYAFGNRHYPEFSEEEILQENV